MAVYEIHVFEPGLNKMLYAHTYEFAEPRGLEQVKERYIANNPRLEAAPQHVFVLPRDDNK